jgi:cytoskeletal protein RodZ
MEANISFLCFQDFLRNLLVAHVLLCVLTLISSYNVADTAGYSLQNQTTLEVSNTTLSERHSRSPPESTSVNTVTTKPDAKTYKPQSSSDDLQISSSEARRTAKSPLVLKLLEEQESTDISNPLAYSPAPHFQPGTEEENVYYHQAPQENADGVPEYAEPEKEILALKAIGVRNFRSVPVAALAGVSRVVPTCIYGHG